MANKKIRIAGVAVVAGLLLFAGLALDWPVLATIGFVGGLVAVGMFAAAMRGSTYSSDGGFSTVDSSAEHASSDSSDGGGSND